MKFGALLLLVGCSAIPADGILDLRAPEEVRAGESVEVYVRARGHGGARVSSYVCDHTMEGDTASSEFRIEGEQTFLWTFAPRVPGLHRVHVSMDGTSRETTVRVMPREIRVLYVEHPPRYEWRFLKNALIRDPSLRAHCLLTSADPDWPQEHTPGFGDPPSKVPADLSKYEVVVMGDATPPDHLVRFVREKGGGLVVISGRTPWGEKTKELLPVTIAGESRDGEEMVPRATDAGKAFFPFAFSADLKPLRWILGARPKEGATVLAEAGGRPLFVTWTAGKGRVFWSATDETWLWRFLSGDEPTFYPLWRRAIEWAAWGR